jgi:hypothetical protein
MEILSYVDMMKVALCTSIDQNEGIGGLELINKIKELLPNTGLDMLDETNPPTIVNGILYDDEQVIQMLYLIRFLELALKKTNR